MEESGWSHRSSGFSSTKTDETQKLLPCTSSEPADDDEEFLHPTLSPLQYWILIILSICITIGASFAYLIWKLSVFIRLWRSITCLPVLFLCVEIAFFFFLFTILLEYSRPAAQRKRLILGASAGPLPRVAVLITSCGEEVEVVQDTVLAALGQKYPVDRYCVWVLDDGGDDELKVWIEKHAKESGRELFYLRRPKAKGMDHHFKAGNLNHALRGIHDEFIAILDADMVVSPHFITTLMPYFTSEKIAFVQSPQAYYNLIPGDPLNGSGIHLFGIKLPHRDAWNSAQCYGTGGILRRKCLSEVGFFDTSSVTEDFGTSFKLHSAHYDSVYVRRRLQIGLAPWGLQTCIKQQQRWCVGVLEIFLNRSPLFVKGSGLYRRLIYFTHSGQVFLTFFAVACLLLALWLCLVDDELFRTLLPAGATSDDFRMYATLFAPVLVGWRLLLHAIFLRVPGAILRQQTRIRSEQAWWWVAPYKMVGIVRSFVPCIPKKFEATGRRKEENAPPSVLGSFLNDLYLVPFHLTYVITGLIAIWWRIHTLNHRDCNELMRAVCTIQFLLVCIQHLSTPILHLIFSPSSSGGGDKRHRRSFLKYDEDGVPVFRGDVGTPQTNWRVLFWDILPTTSVILSVYVAWIALHPHYTLSFCDVQFFDDTPIAKGGGA